MSDNLDKLLKQLVDLHPKFIDLSLTRLKKLLKKLKNPHLKIPPVIHIAGTNGKGSTLSYIKHILMENNYNVHSYISPHLKKFNERIIIKNKQISTAKLLKTLKYIKKINAGNPITFFEITTAAAFYLFSKEKADILILETGLGGRLDATNVIKNSLVDIITPIGLDHQEYLGDDILSITNEKLGIIKKDSQIIISKQKKIIEKHIKKQIADLSNKKLYYNSNYKINKINKKNFILSFKNKKLTFLKPNLIGNHQIENASTAIATTYILKELGYHFSKKRIENGIRKTLWPGRLEKGSLGSTMVYIDGAHNIDGVTQILHYFKSKKIKLWLMIGMLKNKNISGFLKKIKPIINGVIAIPIPNEINSFKTEQITYECKKLRINYHSFTSVNKANNYIKNELKPKTLLISGSLYLVGKIRNKYL